MEAGLPLRVEFHCHSIYSSDSLVTPARLVEICRRRGVDRVVVTDHNSIRGALEAKALDPQRVIVGEEVLTTQGELLAAYVQEQVPEGLEPLEAIARLRAQGAFISVSHPFDPTRGANWEPETLAEVAGLVDAVETFNARCMRPAYNRKAQEYAAAYNLPGTVGSDAHTPIEYGRAGLLLPHFEDAESLKAVIAGGQPLERYSGVWVRLGSRYAVIKKALSR